MAIAANRRQLETSGGAFWIHAPANAWVVESGTLDLFLVATSEGAPAGSRHHVLRVTEGGAVFGVEAYGPGEFGVVACPGPDARFAAVPRAHLEDRTVPLVEAWIATLSAAAVEPAPPKSIALLQPGPAFRPSEATALMPRDGVCWVHPSGPGRAQFLGQPDLAVPDGGNWFPLCPPAWLRVDPDCSVSAWTTGDAVEQGLLWSGLEAFHRTALEILIRNLRQNLSKEAARLARRDRSDGVRLDSALRTLIAPLRPGEVVAPHEVEDDDPWMLACAALEPALGIRFLQHPDRRRGAVLKDPVASIARASGVRVRTVALKGEWWKRDHGPLLCLRNELPVALVPASPRTYEIYDPATRTRGTVDEETAASLDPFAWFFYRPFPQKALGLLDLARFGLRGCGDDLVRIAAAGVATGLLGVVLPAMTEVLFDSVIPGADRAQLLEISLLMLVAAVCAFLFTLSHNLAMLRLEGRMDASIQAAVWDRLLSLPPPFFRDYTAGDLAARSLSISGMRQILTGPILGSVFSGIFSVFSFALLFYYDWRLALLAAGLTFAGIAVTCLAGWIELDCERETMRIKGRLSGMLLEFTGGISKLRVSGTENRAFAAWAVEFARQKAVAARARRASAVLEVFDSAFPLISGAALFWAMSKGGQRLTTGEFLAFFAAFTQFQMAALESGSAIVSGLSVVPLYERAKPILQALPEVDRAKTDPGELSGGLEVRHVSFRYRPDAPLALRDVSIRAPAGRFVAVVGGSGSGKSTLFRLLLGFETPESGSIYFDSQDSAHLDIQAVRQQIGVVLQNGRILGDTIYTNIIGSAHLGMDAAWEAARMAGLDGDINSMPMGMHTVVAEGGGGLSGGQRQRLLIARAVVKKPRILLFDEATSALDNETQAIVSRSLESLQATRIVIAHRLSTIANADYIYVMEKGAVVEEGVYSDLIARGGPFAALAKRQVI